MTTAYAEYAQIIIEHFSTGKWLLKEEFRNLSINELNSAIIEARHKLKYQLKTLNEDNQQLFNNYIIFIKANQPYSADEIFMDMYHSGVWFPHKSLTKKTAPVLNEYLLDKLIEFQDKPISYDINYFNSLCLFIKSFVY